jgi:sugar phosphate isomerase/epimerase
VQIGLSEVEMMGEPIQKYAGIRGGGGQRRGASAEPAPRPTDAEREGQIAKCRELRKLYNDAGVNIHAHKIPFGQSDEEIEFNFLVAKALGCAGITTERNEAQAKKLAPFADKYKIWVGFHNHTNNLPAVDKADPILDLGQYIGFNLDIGHYYAGTKGQSPLPVLEKYHSRILSLHLKDRTATGENLPWGHGQTPIKEVLQLIRKEKWTFPADIELEYKVPQGSTAVAEVGKCLKYCKEALT